MYFKILTSNNVGKERFKKALLYYSKLKGARKSWKIRHGILKKKHPEYCNPIDKSVEVNHIDKWSFFSGRPSLLTLRICGNISGCENPDIIPEEIFQADIEPSLNRYNEGHIFANKSLYDHWFRSSGFPQSKLHSIDGEFMDSALDYLSAEDLPEIIDSLSYPVVFKPNVNSSGGDGIQILENEFELENLIKKKRNFIVQEKLQQHPVIGKYNPDSINTVRVYLYKSVFDNRVHILNIAQRMGYNTVIDNVSAGGLVSFVNEDGYLHGFALDKYGGRYDKHPVTNVSFDQQIPAFEQLKDLSLSIAQKLFHIRVVGLDLFYDRSNCWRPLEINTRGHSIRFAQYAGHPFFGRFTEEVVEYCKRNHWALTI